MGTASTEEAETPLLPPMNDEDAAAVEEILEYRFRDMRLLDKALTHGSFYHPSTNPGPSYERLEFVGDAVLGCLMAKEVFSSYADLAPGNLTKLRGANVDTERLARIAVDSRLHLYLRHQCPQLQGQIQTFMEGMDEYPIHSNGLLDPPKSLADIVESVIGAIFMDSNGSLDTVWKVFRRLAEPLISLNTLGKHPVSELYELCQKYRLNVSFKGDTWTESTMVNVLVDGDVLGSATYSNKKEIAQNRAAKAALDRLKKKLKDAHIDGCYFYIQYFRCRLKHSFDLLVKNEIYMPLKLTWT